MGDAVTYGLFLPTVFYGLYVIDRLGVIAIFPALLTHWLAESVVLHVTMSLFSRAEIKKGRPGRPFFIIRKRNLD